MRVLALALLLVAAPAFADVVDLSGGQSRRSSNRPPTFALKLEGGSRWAPYGQVGAALSYFSQDLVGEIEAGAGAGFPGVQLGLALRKLFGQEGDYLLIELAVAGNTRARNSPGETVPTLFGSSTHAWSDVGAGFQHRAGSLLLGVTGGITFTGFSDTPSWYVHGGVGFGF